MPFEPLVSCKPMQTKWQNNVRIIPAYVYNIHNTKTLNKMTSKLKASSYWELSLNNCCIIIKWICKKLNNFAINWMTKWNRLLCNKYTEMKIWKKKYKNNMILVTDIIKLYNYHLLNYHLHRQASTVVYWFLDKLYDATFKEISYNHR